MIEIILFSIIFAVMAFVGGYLFGCGCQRGEDLKEIKRVKDQAKKTLRAAYDRGMSCQKEIDKQAAEDEFKSFCNDVDIGNF